jgi:hypothetical protein
LSAQFPSFTLVELEPLQRRIVYWGLLWRWVLICVGATVTGALFGLVLGIFSGVIGLVTDIDASTRMAAIPFFAWPVGIVVGVFWLRYLVRWIFRAKFGDFSIRLVRNDASHNA